MYPKISLLALSLLLAGAAQAGPFDGNDALLCSVHQLFECDPPNGCIAVTAAEIRGVSHLDIDFAKNAGMPDVFAHGMLSMAYLGRMLTNWQPQAKLRKFSNRFAAITQLQDVITCSGKVVEIVEVEGEALARCQIQASRASGEQTLLGEALVAL